MSTTGHEQLRAVVLPHDGKFKYGKLGDYHLEKLGVSVTALLRDNTQTGEPDRQFHLQPGDTLILSGTATALDQAEAALLEGWKPE